jgi:hypothetical protein
MKVKSTLLAALAAALLVPAAAQAASVTQDGGAIVYHGEGGQGLWMSLSTMEDWNDGKTYRTSQTRAPRSRSTRASVTRARPAASTAA